MSRNRNRTRYSSKKAAARTAAPAQPAAQGKSAGTQLTRPQAVAQILSALDGYSNAAAFLGEDSILLSSGTFRRSGLTSQTELLTVTYRESWLAKRIIDMPSEDMTRAWYSLATPLPENALHDIYRLEAKHSVKQEITNAIRWSRLYGGAIAVMILRGENEELDQPLNIDRLLPGCFQGLLVLDRAQGIEPSLELVSDLDDPDFGLPMYYTVNLELEDMTIRRLPGIDETAVTEAITAAVNDYINNQLGVAEGLQIPVLYAVAYNADPELSRTFAIADIYANVTGDSGYTRDEITCPWNGKLSILNSGGLTITYRD